MDQNRSGGVSAESRILEAKSIPEVFQARVALSPEAIAYRHYEHRAWKPTTWAAVAALVEERRAAFRAAGLKPGDRIGIFLPNGIDWVVSDLAGQSEGIVTVPLYTRDSSRNIRHVIRDSGAVLCITDTVERWESLDDPGDPPLADLKTVWVLKGSAKPADQRVVPLPRPKIDGSDLETPFPANAKDLTTLVYTSGTTGPPKGVMLSHEALLWNARAILELNPIQDGDEFLSILPLAHGFERSVGWLCPLVGGATVSYCRSIERLAKDLKEIEPTIMLAVPRLFEKIRSKAWAEASKSRFRRFLLQKTEDVGWHRRAYKERLMRAPGVIDRLFWWLVGQSVANRVKAAFGSRIRIVLSGGAPLPDDVARFMAAMEMPLIEGFGLTEAGPAATGSTVEDRRLGSVGRALPGAELRIGEQDELQIHSPGVMIGYWNNREATAKTLDPDGWLHTGDAASIEDGYVYIRGRIKDVVVLSTGENVNPVPIEAAIMSDPIVEQVCVVGDKRSRCLGVVVVRPNAFRSWLMEQGLEQDGATSKSAADALCRRLLKRLKKMPGFAKPAGVVIETKPWTPETGLITPTLKPKRAKIEKHYREALDAISRGGHR